MPRELATQIFAKPHPVVMGPGFALRLSGTTAECLATYCARARIPPANECHAAVSLTGQFNTFTASSASVPAM
ncbi:hypothetical protein FBZ95_104862 [Bradyrhizobium sacchari]|uniref:Uncharacterized protein n=1 Tax=Bradyrhizobium sacchari TaxID=1399419 RepID=A0A560K0Y2_9BRAD|nr:hypothetical protein FBZ95_104862 [Bradyrhizobium sacchari]